MRARYATYTILSLFVVGGAFLLWQAWRNGELFGSEAKLLERLPTQESVVISIDFAALRRTGILQQLAGREANREAEYAQFVHDTGFDYAKDLDRALVAFAPEGVFFLLRGRFDWRRLESYTRAQGGSCYSELCRMQGSQPERRISYVPLQSRLMALAVSKDDLAAGRLQQTGPQRTIHVPDAPVWVSIPASVLRQSGHLPGGARLLASPLADAEEVTLTLGRQGQETAAHLEALCHTPSDATALATQLQKATTLLRDALAKQKPAEQRGNLGELLASGVFEQSGRTVTGRWPLRQQLLDQLLAGI